MVRKEPSQKSREQIGEDLYLYPWFVGQFGELIQRLESIDASVKEVKRAVAEIEEAKSTPAPREFYSTVEFAGLVGRSEYTVREWCRLGRIEAEKAESGRGDAKSWKIPASELLRYHNHGLLPQTYLR